MKTEREKMIAGELYDASDNQLVEERTKTRTLLQLFNTADPADVSKHHEILKDLIPHSETGLAIQAPFFCDYGSNIQTGERVFMNFNCTILDVAPVKIGARTLFGPNVQIYTATHPLNHIERASGLESAKAIEIGEDVWLGGGVIVCPGVKIGNRTVVGSGSVVTKDLPEDVFAAGNPCRVIKQLQDPNDFTELEM